MIQWSLSQIESWMKEQLMFSSVEDQQRFIEYSKGLPIRKVTTPYHCGPHSLRCFDALFALVKPTKILEIGFNLGHSANFMLHLSGASVHSLEIRDDELVRQAEAATKAKFGDRFKLTIGRSPTEGATLKNAGYDLIFIDGGHLFDDVDRDIALGKELGIKWFFMDDWYTCWGPGVIPAAAGRGLSPYALLGNCCLLIG